MPTLIASYSETNRDSQQTMNGSTFRSTGQSFDSGVGGVLDTAKFYMQKTGSPTGNGVASIYSRTTDGSGDDIPDALLATSDNFDVSTLPTSFALITFTFSGAEKITLTASTRYVLTFTDGGVTGCQMGDDESSPSYADGNYSENISGTWSGYSTIDLPFYVYVDDAAPAGNNNDL